MTTGSASSPATSTSTTAATRTPASPGRWVWWLDDSFDGAAIDRTRWTVWSSTPAITAAVANGRLLLEVTPDALPAGVPSAQLRLTTTCSFQGDFDAQVEYELLEWPDGVGVDVMFAASIGNGNEFAQWGVLRDARSVRGGFESYESDVGDDHRVDQTGDVSGAFRMTRVKDVLTTYYKGTDGWVRAASGVERRFIGLTLLVYTNSDDFGHAAARVALDEFQATSDNLFCPVKWPPRRRLPS